MAHLGESPKTECAQVAQVLLRSQLPQGKKLLERLELIKAAKPLTRDLAVIEPAALRVQLLAQQLKSLLPYIARYEKQIAELFDAHPDSFLFRDLPGGRNCSGP
jgi:hypothetical protein